MMNSDYPVNSVWIVSLERHKTSVIQWKSVRMIPKGNQMLKRVSPSNPSSCAGEADDTGDKVHDLRDVVASLEEALSQMGASSKTPFQMIFIT